MKIIYQANVSLMATLKYFLFTCILKCLNICLMIYFITQFLSIYCHLIVIVFIFYCLELNFKQFFFNFFSNNFNLRNIVCRRQNQTARPERKGQSNVQGRDLFLLFKKIFFFTRNLEEEKRNKILLPNRIFYTYLESQVSNKYACIAASYKFSSGLPLQ